MNVQELVALFDRRLDGLSVGRRLITSLGAHPRAIEFAVYRPEAGYTPERSALPFQFVVEPWSTSEDAQGTSHSVHLRGRANVSNALNVMLPMPSSSFVFTLALPPMEAEELYYRDPVADAQQAASDAPPAWIAFESTSPSHAAVRAEVQRIFMDPNTGIADGQSSVTCTARVVGHRLIRRNDRYSEPGGGASTLLRIVEPGDAWAALNLFEGWGEVFSAGHDEATANFGAHFARSIG